ncbi:hypothetical protein TVAG_483100 [Trichomonas vaginalis G3]|uniref:Uncharacterized protein n=1 Tax=Trichomonas vaginalis (strain ATCC PRA-98 / G3) TaxID=412133 RepID=A2FAL0_TRIV3|nr:hypothetical protein TVAGG3_0187500 [Trichomonas vaginalis G3]EAX98053.1 hypothetical protein TVAG_483100 [Trichomonas vaginalis G3]KAI5549742.1 hypothetical protein TVAGG3_0187500 [Trichomonas vaginalis G3]|eukprot:XP_001310983.1 hypothetical protein [Trichomonas vaginalis G3]
MFDFYPRQAQLVFVPRVPVVKIEAPVIPPCPTLKLNVPSFTYNIPKIQIIPFDTKICNGGKFSTTAEAMDFIAQHCLKYHGQITKQLLKAYLPLLHVYDQCEGVYSPATRLSRRDFEAQYRRITHSSN